MDWKSIAGTVAKVAPILGTILGGPAGGAVGGIIAAALGVENTPDAISNAIATDPMAAEKLKEAELNSKVQLQQIQADVAKAQMANDLDTYRAEASDRASARSMQNAPDWWIRPMIVLLLVFGAVAILVLMFLPGTRDVIKDPTATGMIGMLVGYWFKELQAALAFYFGATKEGTETAKQIANFAVTPGTVTAASAKAEG